MLGLDVKSARANQIRRTASCTRASHASLVRTGLRFWRSVAGVRVGAEHQLSGGRILRMLKSVGRMLSGLLRRRLSAWVQRYGARLRLDLLRPLPGRVHANQTL